MRKLKMNEEKFEGITWRNRGETWYASTEISRKPFGTFTVHFEMSPQTGETTMYVKAPYDFISKEREIYKMFKSAVNAAVAYFQEIDELVKKIPREEIYRAESAYAYHIAKVIAESRKAV